MDLLILGASARAAAFSAVRASLRPTAIDLFADRDLVATARTLRVARAAYPDGLADLFAQLPHSPWIYTGGLENHPALVDRIADRRPLWGNAGEVLRRVRDPVALEASWRSAGFPCPSTRLDARGLPRDGSWLVKPLASAGGLEITPLDADASTRDRPCYYQERIEGLSLSAVFVARGESGLLAGVSRQWHGRTGAPFAYAGSLAPWPVTELEHARIAALGAAAAREFGLAGIFGVDFVLRDGIPWPVEVNPRYTASVEVLELALGRSLLAEHCAAFGGGCGGPVSDASPRFVGKRVVYARAPCRFPDLTGWSPRAGEALGLPRLADIPPPGSRFEAGEPVVTVFARSESLEACIASLARRTGRWERRLAQSCNQIS